jgi:hypothetical protein
MWQSAWSWLKSGDWGPTFEGVAALVGALATLTAGVLAFLIVRKQIKSSSGDLQKQLDADKRARQEEQERQKKAVATAILFEIDDFYRYHLRGAHGRLEESASKGELLEVVRIPPSMFAVYRGNTPRLGELPDEVAEVVVHFYSKAEQFFALREDYRAERERHAEPADHPDNRKERTLFGHLRDSLLGLTRAAYIACERLCSFTGVDFKAPRIAIAAEDIVALNRETEQIEHEEVHRI